MDLPKTNHQTMSQELGTWNSAKNMVIHAYSSCGQNEEGYINLGQEIISCVGKNPKLTSENWVGQVAILLSFLFPINSPPKFAIIGHTLCHDSFGNIYAQPDVYKIHNTRRCVEISEKIYFEPRSVLQEVLLWHLSEVKLQPLRSTPSVYFTVQTRSDTTWRPSLTTACSLLRGAEKWF